MTRETGWQSITDKEGSTASGAMPTVKGHGAWGEALLAKGRNASGEWLNKKKKRGEHCLGEHCWVSIANKRGAMPGCVASKGEQCQ